MIYLFDDKRNRQTDYGWNTSRFESLSDVLKPIYLYDEIKEEEERRGVFATNNIILFHESFFDNPFNSHHHDVIEIRNNLNHFAQDNPSFKVVYFSGSTNDRKILKNVAYLPVSTLYQNLDVFGQQVQDGNVDLRYLAFGKNFEIEALLIARLNEAHNCFEIPDSYQAPIGRNFIASAIQYDVEEWDSRATYQAFYEDQDLSLDDYLDQTVNDWFSAVRYDKIFIPLSFGATLSDHLGLRMAMHIRCTESPNCLVPIYIYGTVDYQGLLDHECFDILKTKQVQLIRYAFDDFANALATQEEPFSATDLVQEIRKVKLRIPQDYDNNHSISNEWAIYRWTQALEASNQLIKNINKRIETELYFKYLKTINPVSRIGKMNLADLKIKYTGVPKILYVDDEADKGWCEIMAYLLDKLNQIKEFDYLGEDLKGKSKEGISSLVDEKVRQKDIDVVILDFRLHPDDLLESNSSAITGIQLLKAIKAINPGIQVIIFSATNKVWNLQAILNAGADGFILKESPEFNGHQILEYDVIQTFIKNIEGALEQRFIKSAYLKMKQILDLKLGTSNEFKEFESRKSVSIDVALKLLLSANKSNSYLNHAYLQLFKIIEDFVNLESVVSKATRESPFVWVNVKNKKICVLNDSVHRTQCAMQYKTERFEIYKNNDRSSKLDTNFLVSSVLIFRMGYENSGALKWTEINKDRNRKVAHFNKNDKLEVASIDQILTFLIALLDPALQSDNNVDKGLVLTHEEKSSLNNLKGR